MIYSLKTLLALGLAGHASGAYVATGGGMLQSAQSAPASRARGAVMETEVQFGDASRKSLLAGIDAVANAVKARRDASALSRRSPPAARQLRSGRPCSLSARARSRRFRR